MAFAEARALLAEAAAARVSPALVIEVGRRDAVLWEEAFGHYTYDPGAASTTTDTVFDLASLTKVIATTSIAMRQIEAGRIGFETRVGDLFQRWRTGGREHITLRHLLDHSSGLPGISRLWEHAYGRTEFAEALLELPLEHPAGAASVYSDPGFMLLGLVLEEAAEKALDTQFRGFAGLWGPDLTFCPADTLRSLIAPTEFDVARDRFHHGDVHDENAAALGGVAGHAGLFGPARAVGAFARTVLRTFVEPTLLGSPALMRTFATPTGVPDSSRALGWDTMRPTSSCGTLMSPTAIGHTGFTGTSLWIDWERDLYVVLLTNRVHPTRDNNAHIALRPKVHDAVLGELIG